MSVAKTSLRTKLRPEIADKITEYVVDAVLTVQVEDKPIDLYMVEIMQMQHKTDLDTMFLRGMSEC